MREEALKRGWTVYRGLKGRLWYGVPGVGLVRAATARKLLDG